MGYLEVLMLCWLMPGGSVNLDRCFLWDNFWMLSEFIQGVGAPDKSILKKISDRYGK
ncbi:MAG: hypothetical protein SXA11_11140 [Cyanobacteriota bacterium]|nr:hypothetical protein [Cyanobacteriota bacterium]